MRTRGGSKAPPVLVVMYEVTSASTDGNTMSLFGSLNIWPLCGVSSVWMVKFIALPESQTVMAWPDGLLVDGRTTKPPSTRAACSTAVASALLIDVIHTAVSVLDSVLVSAPKPSKPPSSAKGSA